MREYRRPTDRPSAPAVVRVAAWMAVLTMAFCWVQYAAKEMAHAVRAGR